MHIFVKKNKKEVKACKERISFRMEIVNEVNY